MDTPITRAEHEEFRRTVNAELEKLGAEDKRINNRLEKLENTNDKITNLTLSVQQLTDNVEQMRQLQENEGKRLATIEGRDGEMWRKVVSYVLTVIISLVIGVIAAQIGL